MNVEPDENWSNNPEPGASPDPTPDATAGNQAEDAAAVHTFQVTHKVANPENPESHSLFTSAELTVDEAIAWIRERLLRS